MRLADISLSFQFLRTFTKIFGLAVFLFTASACAQDPTIPTASSTATDTKAALQPYLGKWRPTSYSEELNIGSLTISVVREPLIKSEVPAAQGSAAIISDRRSLIMKESENHVFRFPCSEKSRMDLFRVSLGLKGSFQ